MATHVEIPVRTTGSSFRAVARPRRIGAGVGIGLVGALFMAAPLVIYDWVNSAHAALELPMAVTGWLFGLDRFVQNGYHWWPIVIGAVLLIAYWMVSGLAFERLVDGAFAVRSLAGSLATGFAWGITGFVTFWYVLLAIARDGAPFRATAVSSAFVAPNWVWILGFVAAGLASGLTYFALRRRAAS